MATATNTTNKIKRRRGPARTAAAPRLAATPARQALIVLGMHRSGTSALTRMFNLLGADLPRNVMGPGRGNDAGHWESADLVVVHDELLASAGSRWDDWRAFNPEWSTSGMAETFRARLLAIVQADFQTSPLFLLKDPRICRFMPVWRDVLARFGATPHVAIPVRNPVEVAASLKARDGFPPAKSYLLWLRHVLDAERSTRDLPRAFTTYDSLMDDWRRVARDVANNLGVHWPRWSDTAALDIDRFMSASLRHHAVDPAQLAVRADIVGWVRETYNALAAMAGQGENARARATLDRIAAEFDRASFAFGLALAAESGRADEAEQEKQRLTQEIETVRQDAAAQAAQAREEALRAHDEAARARDEAARASADAAKARDEVAQVSAEAARLREEAGVQAVRFDELAAAHAANLDETARLERDLAATQSDGARLARELDGARGLLREAQTEVQRLAGDVAQAEAGIAAAKQERDVAVAEREALAAELQAEKKAAEGVRAEAARLTGERDDVRDALADMSRARDAARDERDSLAAALHTERAANSRLRSEVEAFAAMLQVRNAAVESERARGDALAEELAAREAALAEATRTVDATRDERDAIAAVLDVERAVSGRLRSEVEAFAAMLQARNAAVESERARGDALAEELAAREAALAEATQRGDATRNERDSLAAMVAAERVAIAEAHRERERLAAALRAESAEAIHLRGDRDRTTAELQTERAVVARTQGEMDRLSAELAAARRDTEARAREASTAGHELTATRALIADLRGMLEQQTSLAADAAPRDGAGAGWTRTMRRLFSPKARARAARQAEHAAITRSRLFDALWYLDHYPDVAAAGEDPLWHYLMHGAGEGREPHPLFDSQWYAGQAGDLAGSGLSPLGHYVMQGAAAGLDPHPLFDTDWYLAQNPDVAAARINPLYHFWKLGAAAGRDPHPLFDTSWYLEQNPDVARAGDNALYHYLMHGWKEGRDPHPLFDERSYRDVYPQAIGKATNPLVHHARSSPLARTSWTVPDSLEDVGPPTRESEQSATRFQISNALYELLDMYHDRSGAEPLHTAFQLLNHYADLGIAKNDVSKYQDVAHLVARTATLANSNEGAGPLCASIIIPVHNKFIYTLTCIHSILSLRTALAFEIVVADDASTDATESIFKTMGGVVRYRRLAQPVGFNANCNAAASLARGRVIVFLNNDTIVLPGWLDELVATLDGDQTIGLAGSKLINADGTLQEAGGIVWQDGSAWNFGRGRNACAYEYNYVKDADYISGASIAVPRTVWTELGGFDPQFAPAYYEDTDLAFRIRATGRRVVYQPLSALIHHEGVSHGRDITIGTKSYQTRNAELFLRRWKDVLAADHFQNGTEIALARDRSRRKPRILIVDHYVPQADRDAGSRSMWCYIKLFIDHGFHVTFWPHNLHFDRAYVIALERLGVEVVYGFHPRWPSFATWIAENGTRLDYAFLSRPAVATDFIDLVKANSSAKILFYGHDIHYKRLEMEYRFNPTDSLLVELERTKEIEHAIWTNCDVIYYPSRDEEEIVRGIMPTAHVRTIPLYIYDTAAIERVAANVMANGLPATGRVLFVGGFRHRPNVDAVIWFVTNVWGRIVAEFPSAEFVIAGSSIPPEIEQLQGPTIKVAGYVSGTELECLYSSAAAAVVPLRFGAGMKGKVIEALSFGVPIVTTSVGAQGLKNPDTFVYVRDKAEEFASAVVKQLQNSDFAYDRVICGLYVLTEQFSVEEAVKILTTDIAELNRTTILRKPAPQ